AVDQMAQPELQDCRPVLQLESRVAQHIQLEVARKRERRVAARNRAALPLRARPGCLAGESTVLARLDRWCPVPGVCHARVAAASTGAPRPGMSTCPCRDADTDNKGAGSKANRTASW